MSDNTAFIGVLQAFFNGRAKPSVENQVIVSWMGLRSAQANMVWRAYQAVGLASDRAPRRRPSTSRAE